MVHIGKSIDLVTALLPECALLGILVRVGTKVNDAACVQGEKTQPWDPMRYDSGVGGLVGVGTKLSDAACVLSG